MTGSAVGRTGPGERSTRLLGAGILFCIALQAWLAIVMEINWDEFFYLAQVYDFQRGDLPNALQSLHVQVLGWLTAVGGDEIQQVVIGRFVMLACEAATCGLIYALCRRFFSRAASLLAALAYVSAGFSIIHGASFRADPLAAMLAMISLVLIARRQSGLGSMVVAAFVAAAAAMVTVKVVFFAPAFAGLAAWRWRTAIDRKREVARLGIAAALALVFFGLLYWLQLESMPAASLSGSRTMIGGAASTTLVDAGFLPRRAEILRAFLLAPVQTALMLFALAGVLAAMLQSQSQRLRLGVLVACACPPLSLIAYRNAFPYFFPFIFPPAMVLIAWLVDSGRLRFNIRLLAIAMTVWGAYVALSWSSREQTGQRQIVAAVHRIFPEPVPYIDRNSMIASFPKRGIFMSTWGMLNYRRGPPLFAAILERETVPLLIVNGPALEQAMGVNPGLARELQLHPQDAALLRDNYLPKWGAIWVAGKHVETGPTGSRVPILIPGDYTVEGASVLIDSRPAEPRTVLHLTRGVHEFRTPSRQTITLRWGNALYRPAGPPPPLPVYRGF